MKNQYEQEKPVDIFNIPQTRQDFYELFHTIRFDFRDDIPAKKIDCSDPDYQKFKCTGAVLVGTGLFLSEAVQRGYIHSKKSEREIMSFLQFARYFNFARNLPTSEQEINAFNHALDAALRGLK